jgi:MFS family permease
MSMSLLVINFTVIVPLLARDALGEGAHGFGLLMASLGAGAVGGALLAASLALPRPPRLLVLGPALVLCLATIALGLAPSFRVAAAILIVIGFCQILFMTSCNTSLQIAAPDRLRGRVMGLYALGFAGITPFGSFLVGSLAAVFGIRAACVAGGGAGIAVVLALAGVWHRRGSS